MTSGTFRFEPYCLDAAERRLTRDGAAVELNARYFDALVLLVREAGRLVSKDRFMDEVWRGIPVTDEALTQCIRTLRRELGDDAAAPRFIETVPKHGYRFIAPLDGRPRGSIGASPADWRSIVAMGLAGTLGGTIAGILGGLFYGFAAAAQPLQAGIGAISILLVIVAITALVALVGAAGVAFGIAATGFAPGRPPQLSIAGGALGGLIVGAIVKLLGLDAFNLLLGHAPTDITGPFEGVLIGAVVGLGAWLSIGRSLRRGTLFAALAGAASGLVIPLLGGRMMGGSLVSLATAFPGSRLRLDRIGALFGESGFGVVSQAVTGALEAALFSACVVGAMMVARRARDNPRSR